MKEKFWRAVQFILDILPLAIGLYLAFYTTTNTIDTNKNLQLLLSGSLGLASFALLSNTTKNELNKQEIKKAIDEFKNID